MQIELASIIPYGTQLTKTQQSLRKQINMQQLELKEINDQKLTNQNDENHNIKWPKKIMNFLDSIQVSRYGFCQLKKEFMFEDAISDSEQHTGIVLVLPMNYHKMQDAPSIVSATEILSIYALMGEKIVSLTKFLKQSGINATGHHPLGDVNEYHSILFPPHAELAGLGEKGRTGLFIDHELGPLVRLGMVTTSLWLKLAKPVDRGINAFCHRCSYCVNHCPPKALPKDRHLESLQFELPMKFKIDADKCIKYFSKHYGCAKCLVKCVLTQPTKHDLEKRLLRIEVWYNKWVKSEELSKLHQKVR